MADGFKGTMRGVKGFAYEVIHLASMGYKETTSTIVKEMSEGHIVDYICGKYENDMAWTFGIYDTEFWQEQFSDFSSYVSGNESRKFGIADENEGLLLLAAVLLEYMKEDKEMDKK